MRIGEILDYFLEGSPWITPGDTVDRIIYGDPRRDVSQAIVVWIPDMNVLRYAATENISLIICHEPTFWNHHDVISAASENIKTKLAFIREHDLAILRIHDSWDGWPSIGIPWAWANFLGLIGPPKTQDPEGYQFRYDIEPQTLETFARRVAARCAGIGEPGIQVIGDLGQTVSRIGIGTGCGCDIETYLDIGCDCSIVCDDGSLYWGSLQMAADLSHPVIRVNHGTSEEPGMISLCNYINDAFPLKAQHFPQGARYRIIRSDEA